MTTLFRRVPLARPIAGLVDWRNRRLRTKVLAAVAVAVMTTIATGVVGLVALSRADATSRSLSEHTAKPLLDLAGVRGLEGDMRVDVLSYVLTGDPIVRANVLADVRATDAQLDQEVRTYWNDSIHDQKRSAAFQQLAQHLAAWRHIRDTQVFPYARVGNFVGATGVVSGPLQQEENGIAGSLDTLLTDEEHDATARAESFQSVDSYARAAVLVATIAGSVLAGLLGIAVVRGVVRRLTALGGTLERIGKGDFTAEITDESSDEVGDMERAVGGMTSALRSALAGVAESSSRLDAASQQLSAVCEQIAATAEESSVQASSVATAAGLVSRNVHTVAAASEEMGASIASIARNADGAARIAGEAVAAAERTNVTVARLSDAGAQIGAVVELITGIARQTSLLALNASIEAMRAGEAGRGFSVVAGEVKALAAQTAAATEDIRARITGMQVGVGDATASISVIGEVISRIHASQESIATAVEEQSHTTREIDRTLATAAAGSTQIADTVAGVAEGATATSSGIAEARRAAVELAELSRHLHSLVGQFDY